MSGSLYLGASSDSQSESAIIPQFKLNIRADTKWTVVQLKCWCTQLIPPTAENVGVQLILQVKMLTCKWYVQLTPPAISFSAHMQCKDKTKLSQDLKHRWRSTFVSWRIFMIISVLFNPFELVSIDLMNFLPEKGTFLLRTWYHI